MKFLILAFFSLSAFAKNPFIGLREHSSALIEANEKCSTLTLLARVSDRVQVNPFSEHSIKSAFEWIEDDGKRFCYSRIGVNKEPYFCMYNPKVSDTGKAPVLSFSYLTFNDGRTRSDEISGWSMDESGCNPKKVALDMDVPTENNKMYLFTSSLTVENCMAHLKNMVEGKTLQLDGQGEARLGDPVSDKPVNFCDDKYKKDPQYAKLVVRAAYRVNKCMEAFPRLLNDFADSQQTKVPTSTKSKDDTAVTKQ